MKNFEQVEVTELSDLKSEMELEGIVTHVTNFSAFVDVGVHRQQISNPAIRPDRNQGFYVVINTATHEEASCNRAELNRQFRIFNF